MRRAALAALVTALAIGSARALDQSGSIAVTADGYREGNPPSQGWLRTTYGLDAQPRPWCFVKLAAVFELDTHGEIRRDALYDDSDRDLMRAPLRFRDLAFGMRFGRFTVVAGRQRLTWKRTSFVNATDNLTPRDWTDPLDEARLSPYALDATWESERWQVEGAVVPRYAPSRLPQLGGRWFELPPGAPAVTWDGATFPPVSWSTLQTAVRAGMHGSRGEARFSYFHGFDDAPRIVPSPAGLERRFVELDVAGFDGELLLGSFVVRAEAGYFHFPEGKDGYGLYQVEGEWSRGGWRLIGGFGDATAGAPVSTSSTSLDLASLPALFVSIGKGDPTEWQASLDAVVGTKDWDSLVRVAASYPVSAHLRAGGELDVIGGAASTFWGRWRANDRLRLYLRADF